MESTSSSNDDKEVANLCLIANHESDNEVSDSETIYKPSFDDLQDAFGELHDECMRLSRENAKLKSTLTSLEKKNDMLLSELDEYKIQFNLCNSLENENKCCENCMALEQKIESLNKTIANFTQISNNLGNILNKQRNTHDRKGI